MSLQNWDENISDTDKVLDHLYQTCFEADSKCAMRKETDKSWHDIRRRVDNMAAGLQSDPLPVTNHNGPEGFITGNDVYELMFGMMYSPLDYAQVLAIILAQAVEGDYTLLQEQVLPGSLKCGEREKTNNRDEGEDPSESIIRWYAWQAEAFASVVSADVEDSRHHDVKYLKNTTRRLQDRY